MAENLRAWEPVGLLKRKSTPLRKSRLLFQTMPSTWLFTKGTESIWVECVDGQALVIAGPGTERKAVEYRSEAELQTAQIALAETLSAGGWVLWSSDKDRRSGQERRAASRDGSDRRQGLERRGLVLPHSPDARR